MKSVLKIKITGIVILLVTLCVVSCKIIDVDEKEELPSGNFVNILEESGEGSVLKMNSKILVSRGYQYTVDRPMLLTAAKGSFDMKGAAIVIDSPGVTLQNLNNIGKLIVSESVGDGDFILENCRIDDIEVRGGGENSGHLNGCVVGTITVDKNEVRIVFGNFCYVGVLNINTDCKIETDTTKNNSKGSIKHVTVTKEPEKIILDGKFLIDNLITRSVGNSGKVKIITKNSDISISKAGDIDETDTVTDIYIESGSDEIDIPFYEIITSDELHEILDTIENTTITDVAGSTGSNVNVPGILTITPESYGNILKIDVPAKCNHINIYRAEHVSGDSHKIEDVEKKAYLVGIYSTISKRPLSSVVSFVDYYVEKDKSYDYYAKMISNDNNNVEKYSEADTVFSKGGFGLLKYTEKPVLAFDEATFTFSDENEGHTEINIHGEPNQKQLMFYFRPSIQTIEAAERQNGITVESTLYTSVTLLTQDYRLPEKSCSMTLISPEELGKRLVLHKIKSNLGSVKNDIKCQWVSLPEDGICGTGFVNNRISFAKESMPFYVQQSKLGNGIDAYLDCSRIYVPYTDDGQTYRVNITNQRNYDTNTVTLKRRDNGPMNNEKLFINFSDVEVGVKDLTKAYFYGTKDSKSYAFFTLGYYNKPATGDGEIHIRNGLNITCDPETSTAVLNSPLNRIASGVIPETIKCSVNGEPVDAVLQIDGGLYFQQQLVDIVTTNTLSMNFKTVTDRGSECELPVLPAGIFYPAKSRLYAQYWILNVSSGERLYSMLKCYSEDSLNYVKGLPEPMKAAGIAE